MIVIENKQVFSDSGKFVHRIGSDVYFHRSTVLPSDSVEDFEEADEPPAFTKAQYDEKVAQLVRERYSESEEFAIQRKYLNAMAKGKPEGAAEFAEVFPVLAEYNTYNLYVEWCKEEANNPELYQVQDL